MPIKQVTYYQGASKTGKTSLAKRSIKAAALVFFEENPKENKVYISQGDAVGPVFIPEKGMQQLELSKESVDFD